MRVCGVFLYFIVRICGSNFLCIRHNLQSTVHTKQYPLPYTHTDSGNTRHSKPTGNSNLMCVATLQITAPTKYGQLCIFTLHRTARSRKAMKMSPMPCEDHFLRRGVRRTCRWWRRRWVTCFTSSSMSSRSCGADARKQTSLHQTGFIKQS